MNALAQSPVFWVGLITGLALLYILPTLIGIARKVEDLGLLIFINLLPTGVGWIAALVMAFMLPRREPVMYQPVPYPAPQYPLAAYPPASTRRPGTPRLLEGHGEGQRSPRAAGPCPLDGGRGTAVAYVAQHQLPESCRVAAGRQNAALLVRGDRVLPVRGDVVLGEPVTGCASSRVALKEMRVHRRATALFSPGSRGCRAFAAGWPPVQPCRVPSAAAAGSWFRPARARGHLPRVPAGP